MRDIHEAFFICSQTVTRARVWPRAAEAWGMHPAATDRAHPARHVRPHRARHGAILAQQAAASSQILTRYISSFMGFLYFSKNLFDKWPLKAFHNDDIFSYKINVRFIMMKVVYIHKIIMYFS